MRHDRRLAFCRQLSRLLLLGVALVLSPGGCGRSSTPSAGGPQPESDAPQEAPRPSPAPEEAIADSVPAEAAVESDPGETPTPSRDRAAERLLLLLPAAPLLVELRITVDGQPLRTLREELVGQMLEAADRDGDGRPTWGEIFADPKRIFGPSPVSSLNMSNRKEFMKANDTNRNGLVDREEARRFLQELNRSAAAFSLTSSSEHRLSGRSIVWTLLDANGDGVLDQQELTALEQRLLIRDANDDQTVTWTELDDSLAGDEAATARRKAVHREDPAALLLERNADWQLASDVLTQQYLQGQPIPAGQALLGDLDTNRDGQLSPDEVAGLDSLEPQVVLSAALGKATESQPGLSLVGVSAETVSPAFPDSQAAYAVSFDTGGCRVGFLLDQRPAAPEPWSSAEEQLAALDGDKNGYLQRREVEGRIADATMFEEADANSDGKIYLDELTAYRRRKQAPQFGAVYALVRYEQDIVFSLLDSDRDGRLTTRELRAASRALADVDSNADGRIAPEEIPSAVVVLLGRGRPPQRPSPAQLATNEKPADLPKWFLSMDSNGDREISREEFPGSSGKFRSLDLDNDGFIVAGEARQAAGGD